MFYYNPRMPDLKLEGMMNKAGTVMKGIGSLADTIEAPQTRHHMRLS